MIPFTDNFKEFFSNYIRDDAPFFEDKRSNKIETVQYFKKTLIYKLVLGLQGQTIKSPEAMWSRKITSVAIS